MRDDMPGASTGGMEPTRAQWSAWGEAAVALAADLVGLTDLADLADRPGAAPTRATPPSAEFLAELRSPPRADPQDLSVLLGRFGQAAASAVDMTRPGMLSHVPSGGLLSSALGEFLSRATNRYTAFSSCAPALVALEEGTLQWVCGLFGLPDSAMGVITTGASMAALSAVVAARELYLGEGRGSGVVYVTEHTHAAMAKAARIAGVLPRHIRSVPVTDDLRMDVEAARAAILEDTARGLTPFFLVGTAGTTDTGAVDPLPALAALAHENHLWFHVDAAYGGFFVLTARGRDKLAGIGQADSIGLDPHKSLFLPLGTGVLLVRDARSLRAPFACDANCLADVHDDDGLPDYADSGPELSREYRGLRLWLPLHLHGVRAFRDALDEKLTLAAHASTRLRADRLVATVYPQELTTVAFRIRGLDDAGHLEMVRRINERGRVRLSSTRVHGDVALRLCVMSHRTHREHVEEALDVILGAAREACENPAGPLPTGR